MIGDGSRLRGAILAMIPLGTLVVLAAVVRWHNIGDLSLWLDELASVTVARAPIDDFFPGVRGHPATAPFDYIVLRGVLGVLGTSTITARLWAFALGVLTVVLVYGFSRELTGNRRAALLAALFTTVAPFLVFYSQEARPYSLGAALAVAIPWAYARLVRMGRAVDWLAFTALAVIAVYSHYFLALLLGVGGVAAFTVVVGRSIRAGLPRPAVVTRAVRFGAGLAIAGIVTGIAFLPWFLFATRAQLSIVYQYPPVPPLTLDTWARSLMTLLSAAPRAMPAAGDSRFDTAVTVTLLALVAIGLAWLARRRPDTAATLLIVLVVLIPLVWFQDTRAGYFVSERQFIFIVPLLLATAGIGAGAIADWVGTHAWTRRRAAGRPIPLGTLTAIVVAAIVVVSGLPGLQRVYDGTFRPKEDWRGAAAYVAKTVCPGGTVYTNVGPGFTYGIGLYAPQLLPRATYLEERDFNEFLVDIVRRYPITARDTVVVFRDRSGVYVPGRGDIQTVTDYLYGRGLRAHEFTPRIRVFTAPACPEG